MKFLVLALVSGCVLSGCAWGGAEEKQDEREQDIEENSGEGQALGKEDVSGADRRGRTGYGTFGKGFRKQRMAGKHDRRTEF